MIEVVDRSKYLGSTCIAAIYALHPHRSARQVYEQKLGISTTETNEDMIRGTSMEPVCKAVYEHATGEALFKSPFRCTEDGILGDTCDFETGLHADEYRCIEFKTHDYPMARDDYGPDGSDQVPDHELIQCQWHMGFANADICELCVWFSLRKWSRFIIYRDREWFAEMRDFARKWWTKHVEGNEPPPLTGSNVDSEYVKRRFNVAREDTIVYSTPEIEALIAHHQACLKVKKEWTANTEQAANQLKEFMGSASVLHWTGDKPITWRNNKDSKKTDWEALVKSLGLPKETIEAFTTTKPGARVFKPPYSRE